MNNITDILVWVLTVFGAANGVAVSALLEPFRNWLTYKRVEPYKQVVDGEERTYNVVRRKPELFGKLVACPMCLGFWFGMGLGLVWFSPTSFFLGDAFFGSATSWIIYLLISDKQLDK